MVFYPIGEFCAQVGGGIDVLIPESWVMVPQPLHRPEGAG